MSSVNWTNIEKKMSLESLLYAVCDSSNATDIDMHETRDKIRTAFEELFTTQRIYENESAHIEGRKFIGIERNEDVDLFKWVGQRQGQPAGCRARCFGAG